MFSLVRRWLSKVYDAKDAKKNEVYEGINGALWGQFGGKKKRHSLMFGMP